MAATVCCGAITLDWVNTLRRNVLQQRGGPAVFNVFLSQNAGL